MTLKAIDLFAGAGGLSLGVEHAGYSVVYSVEHEPVAVQTLNVNRAEHFPQATEVRPHDITALDPSNIMSELGLVQGELNLLVGGPPCVAFSKSGFHLEYKRAGADPRASLLDDYLRFLDAFQPEAYMMENVFGLAYQNQSSAFLSRLLDGIQGLGYSATYEILNAADYGVPQNRQRLFLIGSRDGRPLAHPRPTHWGEHERRVRPAWASQLHPHVTAGEALEGLVTDPEPEEAVNGKWGYLLPDIPPGGNYLFYTAHEGHSNPIFEWRSRYWTFLLKLGPNRPSPTIQGRAGPVRRPFPLGKPSTSCARLRRLQGFPDSYVFAGNRREIQLQIGNSVPPPLARTVADAIRRQLAGEAVEGAPEETRQPMLL